MRLVRGIPALIAVLLTAAWLGGCAAPINTSANSFGSGGNFATQGTASASDARVAQNGDFTSTPTNSAYKIGASDVLDISVFKVPELSKTVQVAESGTINLPLVGEVPAAGKTTQQLERDLTAQLGDKYLQNPQVAVMVKENNSQRVTIQGAVAKPGVYPLKSKTTLLELIALAGGFNTSSDSTVLVLRNSGGKRMAAKFDVDVIQKGQSDDPAVQSGDIVVAGTSAIRAGFNNVLKVLPIAGMFAIL